MSSSTCSCWSSRRRSTSATCSSRGAGWPSAGTPTSRPPGRQFEHERHLKAINEAADQLERLAEGSRGGQRLAQRRQGQRRGRPPRARGGRPARLRGRAARARPRQGPRRNTTRSAAACPTTRSCTATRAASPIPEWGVGTVAGIYFSDEPSPTTARRCSSGRACKFSHGIRTVPAGSMSFVDFSKPDPAEERVERFMIAAQRAMAEGEYLLAAQRLIYARDAEPRNVAVLRLMTLAFWQAGKLDEAARAVRDWARVDGVAPCRPPLRRAHLRGHGRHRSRRGGRRARRRARPRRRRARGSASGACACS